MKYKVEIARSAEDDLVGIAEYYLSKAGPALATDILSKLGLALSSLADHPERGHKPHELYDFPDLKELEIVADPYRVIYQIRKKTVYIIAIFDGRQDVKSHLRKRLTQLLYHRGSDR